MDVLLPIGYFPPISYFAWLLDNDVTIEQKEHFIKQSLRSRCTILGANGPQNLLVPRTKTSSRAIEDSLIHSETDWKTQHWRSLISAYQNSPYFEFYEDELQPFFEKNHTHHFQLGLESIQLSCSILQIKFEPKFTTTFKTETEQTDLRSAWNKRDYENNPPAAEFERYIQVFRDRHPFESDLSILDLIFCVGPSSIDYLRNLKLRDA